MSTIALANIDDIAKAAVDVYNNSQPTKPQLAGALQRRTFLSFTTCLLLIETIDRQVDQHGGD